MEKDKEPKKVNRIALIVLGVVLMFVNLWMANSMQDEKFISFVVMAFIVNGVLGLGFSSIYRTVTRKDNK